VATYADFQRALEVTLRWEGPDSDDPHDPGGYTRFGIAQRHHPDVDVRRLTRDGAEALYWSRYWSACRCSDLPPAVAIALFDTAVNVGVSRAIDLLQQAAAVPAARRAPRVGQLTLDGARRRPALEIAQDLLQARARYYLSKDSAHEERYERGWLARVVALAFYLGEVAAPSVRAA
jgi:lysozyme family protein